MAKRGYKCIQWKPSDEKYIADHYTTKSNAEIAAHLKRTEDAVRKRLNELGLRRPLKSETKQLDKAANNDKFFKALSDGLKKRKQLEKVSEERVKSIVTRKEPVVYATKPQAEAPEKVWVVIDSKTRVQCTKGKEKETIERFTRKGII